MEKARGMELGHFWPNLDVEQRLQVIRAIVQFEKLFTSSPFVAMGSLYYAEQLDAGTISIPTTGQQNLSRCGQAFVIGPTTDRRLFYDGRHKIQCDRGPCMSQLHPA